MALPTDLLALVEHGHSDFPIDFVALRSKVGRQRVRVYRLQQAETEIVVDVEERPDDRSRQALLDEIDSARCHPRTIGRDRR